MVKNKNHRMMRWALLLMTVPLWHGCSDDAPADSTVRKERVQMELRSYSPGFQEEVIQSRTRAFPDDYGYKAFTYYYNGGIFAQQENFIGSTINLWFTQSANSSQESVFTYNRTNDKWNSTAEMQPSQDYYLYGFIPREVVTGTKTISPYNGDYKNGAVISLTGVTSITPSDFCVTVAAGNGNDAGPAGEYGVGKYSYQAISGETNYIYLLFDHLYASLNFSFKVNPTYADLRTIKLKKLQLQSTSMKQKVDAVITLEAKTDGASPLKSVTFSDSSYPVMTTSDGVLFDTSIDQSTDPVTLRSDVASNFIGCIVPALSSSPVFTLTSTYDVYDKPTKGESEHLIREDCTASNTISLSYLTDPLSMTRGKMLKINLTVNPTYLYMLSEPDLDNPTITIN